MKQYPRVSSYSILNKYLVRFVCKNGTVLAYESWRIFQVSWQKILNMHKNQAKIIIRSCRILKSKNIKQM